MKCQEFTQWLQERLDDRAGLTMPPEINDHVVRCDSCRGQLNAWNQISGILPVQRPEITASENTTSIRRRGVALVSAVAAVALFAFLVERQRPITETAVAQVDPLTEHASDDNEGSLIASSLSVDPASLWQEIQSRDWVAQSMPTVESVRDSFAPMGRSLVQAMTILATGGRDQPS